MKIAHGADCTPTSKLSEKITTGGGVTPTAISWTESSGHSIFMDEAEILTPHDWATQVEMWDKTQKIKAMYFR